MTVPIPPPNTRRRPPPDPRASSTFSLSLRPCQSIYLVSLHAMHSRLLNGGDGISDIEGKATRVGASERGKRASFNSDTPSPCQDYFLTSDIKHQGG